MNKPSVSLALLHHDIWKEQIIITRISLVSRTDKLKIRRTLKFSSRAVEFPPCSVLVVMWHPSPTLNWSPRQVSLFLALSVESCTFYSCVKGSQSLVCKVVLRGCNGTNVRGVGRRRAVLLRRLRPVWGGLALLLHIRGRKSLPELERVEKTVRWAQFSYSKDQRWV